MNRKFSFICLLTVLLMAICVTGECLAATGLSNLKFTSPTNGQTFVVGQGSVSINWTNPTPNQGMSQIFITCEEGGPSTWPGAPTYFVTRTNVGVGRSRFSPSTNNMPPGFVRTVRAVATGTDGVRYATGPWFTLIYSMNSVRFENSQLTCPESVGEVIVHTNNNEYIGPVGHVVENPSPNILARVLMVPVCVEGEYQTIKEITDLSIWTNGVKAGSIPFQVKIPFFASDFNPGTSRPDVLEAAQILNYERALNGLPQLQIETTMATGAFLEELANFKTRNQIVETGAGPLTLMALNIASTNWYSGRYSSLTDASGNRIRIKINNLIKYAHEVGVSNSFDVFIKVTHVLNGRIHSPANPVYVMVSTPNMSDFQPGLAYNIADPSRATVAILPANSNRKDVTYILGQNAEQGGRLWISTANLSDANREAGFMNVHLFASDAQNHRLLYRNGNSEWNEYTNSFPAGCGNHRRWKVSSTNSSWFFRTVHP